MPGCCQSEGLWEPKAPFIALTLEDRARWKCGSKQRVAERIDHEHQSFPQHRQPTAPPSAGAQTSLVERVQEPLEAHLADSLLGPDSSVASTESAPVETLQLSLSLARVADLRGAPDLRGCSAAEEVLPSTPSRKSELPTRLLQITG